jgi:2',3'-cyclic-nucleotide 2'-phosphodiesterase (5'-nucleotidase family)
MHATVRAFLAIFVAFLVTSCASIAPKEARFAIVQLNDVYKIEGLEGGMKGGLARVRTLRKQLEADGTPVLILHGGDALYPSVMSKYLEAKPMVDVLNLLDGDNELFDPGLVLTFGNHEFDNSSPDILLARMKESQFRWVSTNVWSCSGETCDGRLPSDLSVLTEIGGRRVGIFGLLYPMKRSYVESRDVIETARQAVRSLRLRRADVIIAITHQQMGDDVKLAEQVSEIDVVIGGHDHLFMQERANDTWITKADADALSVVVHDVVVSPMGHVTVTPRRVMLDASIPKDETVNARVSEWLDRLGEELGGNAVLGFTKQLLEGVEPAIRGRETALGNLIADAMREQMGADVALINGGSIRINDNIPPGPITNYDMEGIFYYKNKVVAARLTGAQVLDVLRNAVSRADDADGRFAQVSGLTFTYEPAGEGFTVSPEDVRIGGRPLDLSANYSVAMSDFLYTRGTEDGFTLFAEAQRPPKVFEEREADLRTVVEKAIRTRGTVDVGVEGRIRRE